MAIRNRSLWLLGFAVLLPSPTCCFLLCSLPLSLLSLVCGPLCEGLSFLLLGHHSSAGRMHLYI